MDKSSEIEILTWLKEILSLKIDEKKESLMDLLSSGVILCNLINKFVPNKCRAVESSIIFKRMENIEVFLRAAREIGVTEPELFQSVDLVYSERRNPKQVCICIYSLSRNLKKKFPRSKYRIIGPRLSSGHMRKFSEEQLDMGSRIISAQMGTNKGATQSGHGPGTRQITPSSGY